MLPQYKKKIHQKHIRLTAGQRITTYLNYAPKRNFAEGYKIKSEIIESNLVIYVMYRHYLLLAAETFKICLLLYLIYVAFIK